MSQLSLQMHLSCFWIQWLVFAVQKNMYVQNTMNLNPVISPDGHYGNSGSIQAAHEGY